jgi:FkbH-like protein
VYDLTWQNDRVWRAAGGDKSIPPGPPDPEIERVGMIAWEEHCIECAVPDCYSTCRLYVPRPDRKCARFVYGIYPNRSTAGLFRYGADVLFRRWGKIETTWQRAPRMVPVKAAASSANWDRRLSRACNLIAGALQAVNPKRRINGLHAFLRRHWLDRASLGPWTNGTHPEAFYVKFYNPEATHGELVLEGFQERFIFREAIPFGPGWTEHMVPIAALNLDPALPGRLLARPADDRETRLVFTWLDFVQFARRPTPAAARQIPASSSVSVSSSPASKVKCVVWDLDGTVWDGIIGDDGHDGILPRPHALELIRKLDERGFLQSIASKNDYAVAWRKVESLGLADYFLYPAIHWGPKSASLESISKELNIGVDTLVLVDDSPFERAEVEASLPQVRTYDAAEVAGLLGRPEFDVPVTPASRTRRLSYLAEAQRKRVFAGSSGDYLGFLRSCAMTLKIFTPGEEHRTRCLELIHRSNQLNLSTRRYSDGEFDDLLTNSGMECFALESRDRFGDYGLVGFIAIALLGSEPTMVDFVLSCRVAQKKVEETVISWYAERARQRGARALRVRLIPSERNGPMQEVLAQLPFGAIEGGEGGQLLEMPLRDRVVLPDILTVDTADA